MNTDKINNKDPNRYIQDQKELVVFGFFKKKNYILTFIIDEATMGKYIEKSAIK